MNRTPLERIEHLELLQSEALKILSAFENLALIQDPPQPVTERLVNLTREQVEAIGEALQLARSTLADAV
ncbi:hypothetical protein JL100_012615 [Skermanella mucosa]|uniref:hypothetical protein n=1 Tax=Skermanella mucosa TaxID=1789672 RepID=UPI00192A800B|nr:hypothetical protein [Skermanella mucosa]UEM23534.1 hypothetical protein JL100_012615 [Skermanella mucosa]